MALYEEVSQLLFPTRCFGCNAVGISICSTCRQEWSPHYYLSHISKLRIHSAVIYSKTASRILLAAKEQGLKGADILIIDSLVHVLSQGQFDRHNIRLVPIPSSNAALRRRGRSFIVEITETVAKIMGLPQSDCLEVIRKVRDQSGLHATARSHNLHGAFGLKRGVFPRGDLIVIDDVVTTGATLGEAARVLKSQGFHVLASVTACVAQPLR